MWQPKWYQWLVIWSAFITTLYAAAIDMAIAIPFVVTAGVLLVWMLQARAARS
jgi:hypothetical protein